MSEEQTHWGDLRLNMESFAPLWVQLAREVRRSIAVNGLKVGTELPSEHWLIVTYGLTIKDTGPAYEALADIGQIEGDRRDGFRVAEELPLEYVTVKSGSLIHAPAHHDPIIKSHLPDWAVIALCVEAPGADPIYYDGTRTVLLVD